MLLQRTLKKGIYGIGIGLHSGNKVKIVLKPAAADHGIRFMHISNGRQTLIDATADNVVATNYATSLGNDGQVIGTVEHLLAAFYGLGVDNALVEVHGDEIPIMDGSAIPFVFLIKTAGIVSQQVSKKFLVLKKKIMVAEDDKKIVLEPSRSLSISCFIDFHHPLLKKQQYTFWFSDANFERQISRARTFGFLKEVEMLKSHGLARGGSLENAIVLDDFGVMNEGGLRFANECARHKVLDCLGDISLLGMPMIAGISAYKAGHALNHQLVRKLLATPDAWEVVEPLHDQPSAKRLDYEFPSLAGAEPQFLAS